MQSIHLTVAREEFLRALSTLGIARRRRFVSILPVWLSLTADGNELQIVEDQGSVVAVVPATGTWPAAGATVDLFMLRRAVENWQDDSIALHAVDDAIMLVAERWRVRLNLLTFGPDQGRVVKPQVADYSELPLFRWASWQDSGKR